MKKEFEMCSREKHHEQIVVIEIASLLITSDDIERFRVPRIINIRISLLGVGFAFDASGVRR